MALALITDKLRPYISAATPYLKEEDKQITQIQHPVITVSRQALYGTIAGAASGWLASAAQMSLAATHGKHLPGYFWRTTTRLGALGGFYNTVNAVSAATRERHDYVNRCISGSLAGAMVGFIRASGTQAAGFAALFSVLGTVYEYRHVMTARPIGAEGRYANNRIFADSMRHPSFNKSS